LRVLLVLRSNPLSLRLICFMPSVMHAPCQQGGFAEFPYTFVVLQFTGHLIKVLKNVNEING
jgi:hypothetical protein